MKDFDVVVIGAGLGGLSSATSLAKAGKKVLLLEKHSVPGGYASSFVRKDFEFEVALHALSGLGNEKNQGPVWKILDRYGVRPKVDFILIPELYNCVFPAFEITIPFGRENFENILCERFPEDKESIRNLCSIIFNYSEEYIKALRMGMDFAMTQPGRFPTLTANFGKTVDEVIKPIVANEKIRAIVCQTWAYLGLPPARLSFSPWALMMSSYIRFGAYHIRGTSQSLSQAFVDTIEELGGEVWLNNGAKKILTSKDKVTGVVTSSGTEIIAPYVICSANPITTCIDLLGADNVPSWYLKRLGAWTPATSTFNVYLGMDCPYDRLGIKAYENFVNLSYDINQQYESMNRGIPDGITVTAYNVLDSSYALPGKSVMTLTLGNYSKPWLRLKGADYFDAKNHLADKCIALAEKVAPDLRQHIEVMEIATPLTNMRYTGNLGGSIYGFDQTYESNIPLPNRGPLKGLYFANAWVNIGGGFETCLQSGFFAARDALKDMNNGGSEASLMNRIQAQAEKQSAKASELKETVFLPDRQALKRFHAERVSLRVIEIIRETESTKTLRMEPLDGDIPFFRAGQYINLVLNIDGVITSRAYSISSLPGKPYYDLTVRRMPIGYVSHFLLDRTRKGDVFTVSGPHGNFYYEPLIDTEDLVFLAGGSGITPFMSMIRELTGKKKPLNIHLLYGSRNPADIVFEEELLNISHKHKNVKVDFIISEPPTGWKGTSGLLDQKMIGSLVGSIKDKTFLMCGPAQMYKLCDEALKTLGVPLRSIRKEVFGPPADVTMEQGWPAAATNMIFNIIEERLNKSFKAKATEPLLVSMEKAGIVVPAICRSGECMACRTKLLKGKVFIPPSVHCRQIDDKANYIHPCMCFPVEDLRIRISTA